MGAGLSTAQFYLYGKRHCTKTGWQMASSKYPKPDILESLSLHEKVYIVTGANSGIGFGMLIYKSYTNIILSLESVRYF